MGRDPVTPAKMHGALTLRQASPAILSPLHTSSTQGNRAAGFTGEKLRPAQESWASLRRSPHSLGTELDPKAGGPDFTHPPCSVALAPGDALERN